MKIKLKNITVKELADGYKDNQEGGVTGFGGKLDIRPRYQREFIYKDAQRDAVIDTISKGHPLNVMYWSLRANGDYEVIDGQQRTISICQYVKGDFSTTIGNTPEKRAFHNLQSDEQQRILDYKLMVYECEGTDSKKLEWFKTINIAGEKLTDQELRNAVYSGSWVTDAKRHFSKNGCPAYEIGHKYLSGVAIRQEYLETAIKWISNDAIEDYKAKNQHEPNANEIWLYFDCIISWIETTFPEYRKEMKGRDWGSLYKDYGDQDHDSDRLETEITRLMQDDDVTNKKGIYNYVLTREAKHLNIRAFSDSQKTTAYEKQRGICKKCGETFELSKMEADHITPWHEGGKTIPDNCQMLCKECNRRKSGK